MDNLFETINKIIGSPYLDARSVRPPVLRRRPVAGAGLLDATRTRASASTTRIIVGVAVLTSLVFPFIGTLVYAILRPAEYLAEVRERELEMRAMEQELHDHARLPVVRRARPARLLACPSCRRPLRSACPSCDRVLGAGLEALPVLRARPGDARRGPRSSDQPAGVTGTLGASV